MCDGCPDITVHGDELVWSCRLGREAEVRRLGADGAEAGGEEAGGGLTAPQTPGRLPGDVEGVVAGVALRDVSPHAHALGGGSRRRLRGLLQ